MLHIRAGKVGHQINNNSSMRKQEKAMSVPQIK